MKIPALVLGIESMVRRQFSSDVSERPAEAIGQFIRCVLLCGICYGAVMGSFSGFLGERLWQVIYSSAKVPFLLLVTFFICLPSFFVFNTLLGVRSDFRQALGALASSQAGLTIVLCSFAPLTALWYLSADDYSAALLFNGLIFAVASLAGQLLLRRRYQSLIVRSRKHVFLLRIWLLLYVFVGIQLGWVLRPFVGQPGLPPQFFRSDVWGNAYVSIVQHVWSLLGR